MSGPRTYTPVEWMAESPLRHQRIVPIYRLVDPELPNEPSDGPMACAGLVPELQPQVYLSNGTIPQAEVERLIGVLRARLAAGESLFDDRPIRVAPPESLFADDADVVVDETEVERRRAEVRAAAQAAEGGES